MRLKILKYDKDKAIGRFFYFKLLELFGLFLFTFGFETLGRFMYTKYDWLTMPYPTTYMEFWLYGFLSLLCVLFIGFATFVIVYSIGYILVHWIKLNWFWAKRAAEDEGSKIERLSEQKKLKEIRKIEKLEDQRKEYGYCVGDTAVREMEGTFGKVGDKYKVIEIDDDGNFTWDEEEDFVKKGNFKFIKKKLDKKPKLNRVREEEVKEKKK